jgi:hypothetical protein
MKGLATQEFRNRLQNIVSQEGESLFSNDFFMHRHTYFNFGIPDTLGCRHINIHFSKDSGESAFKLFFLVTIYLEDNDNSLKKFTFSIRAKGSFVYSEDYYKNLKDILSAPFIVQEISVQKLVSDSLGVFFTGSRAARCFELIIKSIDNKLRKIINNYDNFEIPVKINFGLLIKLFDSLVFI